MLRADWLADAVTVPYVATLGPVHPDAATAAVFEAVLAVAPGAFVAWDKDRRWGDHKHEWVLRQHVVQTVERTTIPTLSRRGGGRITVYDYARTPPELPAARRAARTLAERCGAGSGRVVWFGGHDATVAVPATRVLLAPTGTLGPAPDEPIHPLDDCPPGVQDSFQAFARRAEAGMAYLAHRHAAGIAGGPILVAMRRGQVVGAIGPLQIQPDPVGALQLLPQYFTVLPEYRRGGHGRALWRAAQRWGCHAGATYQLLQAQAGGAADRLYKGEGVRSLGLLHTLPA